MAKLSKAPKIDLGDLIESTALSVQRALQARGGRWPYGPITIGIIFDPAAESVLKSGMSKTVQ